MKAYHTWAEKSIGTVRTTYLIGPEGKIKAIMKKVKPAEHVMQPLKALAS